MKFLYYSICLLLLSGCLGNEKPAVPLHTFTNELVLPHTPVQNQGRTSSCWAFTTASLMESELLQRDQDTLRLSVMYAVRQKYLNQFDAYYYSQGKKEIRNGSLGHSFQRVWKEDGMMPRETYRGLLPDKRYHDHRALLRALKNLAKRTLKYRDYQQGRRKAEELLDKYMGKVPETFDYQGHTYTARSFADSMQLHMDDYVRLTSFLHHPFGEEYPLEVPDNWEHGTYLNLPLDEMEQQVRQALSEGKTVAWDGDISELTFRADAGIAYWEEPQVTPELRQRYYETFETTDDHMMHIIGTAHDEKGHFYYLVKNSWGRLGPFKGLLYMSDAYFRAKTVSVMFRK